MEASMSFGCYSVEGSVSHCRRVEETVQLCGRGGAQSVLILERQSSADYCPQPGPLVSARRGHLGCVKCPMHCGTMGHCKKSSIFDIFWDQINGKHCSVQSHVCQPQEIYSLGCFNVYIAKESHQIAQATAEKNARLKEAFGIGDSYVDGSSFDPNRKAKEEQAKAVAMAQKKYAIVRESSSSERSPSPPPKKKKKKSSRDDSRSPERKEKKKKSKKHKRDR